MNRDVIELVLCGVLSNKQVQRSALCGFEGKMLVGQQPRASGGMGEPPDLSLFRHCLALLLREPILKCRLES